MDPTQYDELLSAYLDRELSPDERATVDRLLERSPEARERLRELQATSRFLRELPAQPLDSRFAQGVIDRLRAESLLRPEPVAAVALPRRRLALRIGMPLGVAASLLIAVWATQQSDTPQRATPHHFAVDDDLPANSIDRAAEPWKVGDVLEILGPSGQRRFELVVLATSAGPDTLRCILGESAGISAEPAGEAVPESNVSPATAENRMTIEADADQITRLNQLLDQSGDESESKVPFVDIQLEPQGGRMAALEAYTQPSEVAIPGASTTAAAASAPPADTAKNLRPGGESLAGAAVPESADPDLISKRLEAAASAPSRATAKSAAARAQQAAPTPDAARDRAAVQQQMSRRSFIKELEITQTAESQSVSARPRSTRNVVKQLAEPDSEGRITPPAVARGDRHDERDGPRRVEVLLRFRNDHP